MLHHHTSSPGTGAQKVRRHRALSAAVAGVIGAAGLVSTVAMASPAGAVSSTAACPTVLAIAARGSTEKPGDGSMASVESLIASDVNATVGNEAVVYPATLQNYSSSVGQGDSAMATDIANAISACPNEKLVLLGYSQGGQIVGDVLAGGGGASLNDAETAPISAALASHVVAAIQYGDPRHQPNLEPTDLGTDPGAQGIFAVGADQSRAGFSSILRSWCDTGDPFCAGGNNLQAHLDYPQKYDSAAAAFVVSQLNAAGIN